MKVIPSKGHQCQMTGNVPSETPQKYDMNPANSMKTTKTDGDLQQLYVYIIDIVTWIVKLKPNLSNARNANERQAEQAASLRTCVSIALTRKTQYCRINAVKMTTPAFQTKGGEGGVIPQTKDEYSLSVRNPFFLRVQPSSRH